MNFSYSLDNKSVITLSISIMCLALIGCTGPAGPQGLQVLPSPYRKATTIVISPNVVDMEVAKIKIYGSGFTPGSIVSIGIPGVPKSKKIPEIRDVWFEPAITNKYGAFAVTANLKLGLWGLVGKTMTNEEALGTYTVVATNDSGETATAALDVVEKLKK